MTWADRVPWPMGDALADPMTGVAAAAACFAALHDDVGALLDVSMHEVCAAAAVAPRIGPVDISAAEPRARGPRNECACRTA